MGAVEKRVTKEVAFELTESDKVERAHKASEIRMAQASISEEFKRAKSAFKGRIEAKENELSALLASIHEGVERRVVDCIERFDYTDAVVETLFGGDVVESRPMTNDERQMGLKFKKKADEPEQSELPLAPSTSPALANPEPVPVELPAPDHIDQETFVPGDDKLQTKVRYAAESWLQEPGEGGTYRVVSEDVFGTATLLWRRLTQPKATPAPAPVAEQPAAEPAQEPVQ